MTIYLDIIFLENFILTFIILCATGVILRTKINIFKLLLGSSIGSAYVVITYLIKSNLYSNLLAKIILSIIIIYISFNPKKIKQYIKSLLFFYLTSFIFGGASLMVISLVNGNKISIKNGIIIGKYTIFTILLGGIIAFLFIAITFKFIKGRITKDDLICNIEIKINNKLLKLVAMIDTGNMLKEPITNTPVIVVEHTSFKEAIPIEILNNIDNILGGDLSNVSEEVKNEYIPQLTVIPFTSLGKQNGMLLGLRLRNIHIEQQDNIKYIEKAIIGLYNKKLSKKGEYQALVGVDII